MTAQRKYTARIVALVSFIVVVAIAIGASAVYGYVNHQGQSSDHKIIVQVNGNGALTIAQAKHTECRAQRSSALDDERWHLIFTAFATPGLTLAQGLAYSREGKNLPSIDTLTNKGGTVGKQHFIPCPPSIASSTTNGTTP